MRLQLVNDSMETIHCALYVTLYSVKDSLTNLLSIHHIVASLLSGPRPDVSCLEFDGKF